MKSYNTEDFVVVGFGCTLAVLIAALMSIISYLVYGYVFATLWLWFVVPIFPVAILSIPQAIGLSMVIGFLTKSIPIDKGEDKRDSKKKAVDIFIIMIAPFITLGMGWIIYTYFIIH